MPNDLRPPGRCPRMARSVMMAIALVLSPSAFAQNLFFQSAKADHCVRDGYRQWSAIIDGYGYYGDWVWACRMTRAIINGAPYPSRNCGWNGPRVWGQFDVPDQTCAVQLYFQPARAEQCLPSGAREYSAIIDGRNYTGDWVEACRKATAEIGGASYTPRDCGWYGSRVWGKFDVPDASCRTRVRGKIQYQDYRSRFKNPPAAHELPMLSAPPRAVRRAPLEIWYGSAPGRTKQVVHTAEDGTFDTYVPTDRPESYRAVVVASNPAGQANLKDNTVAWYWTPEHILQPHPDGDGLLLSVVFSDPHGDAMSFNAADALLVAYDYALAHGIPAERLNRVSLVPEGSPVAAAPRTTPSGAWSLIWLPVDWGGWNFMFDDETILHEYAHHLQRMNDTYALWPAIHTGCWAEVTPAWSASSACDWTPTGTNPRKLINSAEYAWFEGFPEYFRVVAGRWGSAYVNGVRPWTSYYPAAVQSPVRAGTACVCPAAAMPTIGPQAVEDYVASLLLDLVEQKNVAVGGGTVLSQDQLEKRLLELWFHEMKTVRTPGAGMPRVSDFQALWNLSFPGSPVLNALMTSYGM